MVRKRSRTTSARRKSRKLYDSDEIESESDLDLDSAPSSPAPKRYTLRQRKRPVFCEDFDYEDEEELNVNRHHSDDEEYDVEEDLTDVKETQVMRNNKGHPRRNSTRSSQVSVSRIEPDTTEAEEIPMQNGLIDFEDVIRADVVVNKQVLDYDNIINRSEIEVDPLKPKAPVKAEPKESHGSTTEFLDTSADDDNNLEVQIDPLNFVQSDFEEHSSTQSNGKFPRAYFNERAAISEDKSRETSLKNGSCSPLLVADVIERYVPPELDEKEKKVVLSNEYLLGNSFDMSADEFLEKQAQKHDALEEDEVVVPLVNFDDDSNSDDDVVIIEKKPEIIVLDDD
ncbi:hypothetical protein HUJ04_004014 [Dendroctonus ponderosae]|nr:hypothetical protein HUJ04_004014 [Dendroctonus ponderosae]